MLTRIVAVMLLLATASAALAMSYSFGSKASGRLDGPILFEFYRDSITRPKTDISRFVVSVRTPDHRWKPVWSVSGRSRVSQPIEYGIPPVGFTTSMRPKKLTSGRVYAAFASDGHGGSSMAVFRFERTGKMTFPRTLD